jgi:tetratricopeptide (TPR) repeat protein
MSAADPGNEGGIRTEGGDYIARDKMVHGDQVGGDKVAGDKITNIYHSAPPQPADEETLAAAEQRLAGLPLDEAPPVAPLPSGSRMPYRRNPLFVGRQADLKQLARVLKGEEGAVAVGQTAALPAVGGLGGIGKTQLAAEFVHRYGQFFAGGVFWLSFGEPAAVPAEVAGCGGREHMNLATDFETLDLETQVRLVLSAWQSGLPRLLVYDNCEAEALLEQWRPPSGGCRVLVTSRRANWDAALGVQPLALGVLERAESVALLSKLRSDLAEGDAAAIAAELGDLPLALHLAGSYLNSARNSTFGAPAVYLKQLRNEALLEHPSLQGWGASYSPTHHEMHVARTFALSYERLDPGDLTDRLALTLLRRAAYFAAGEPIPRKLLLATAKLNADDFKQALDAEKALARLVALGLLDEGAGGALVLHRLLAAFVREVAADAGAQVAVEEALYDEASRVNQAGYPAPLLAWQAHLRAVTDAAQRREDEQAARLCSALDFHLNMIGDYWGALPYSQRALAICEKALGAEHPATATSLNNLGHLISAMGNLGGARPYLERALAIDEKVLGGDHPDTAIDLNNLGRLLQDMGDLAGARPYYERALAIYEQALGAGHPHAAASLNNLGVLLQAMGDLGGARPYLERALAIYEQALGAGHPHTATSLNNLGMLLQAMGDLAGARLYLERALRIWEKALGPDHPHTRLARNNLAALAGRE